MRASLTLKMSNQMTMIELRAMTPADAGRGKELVATMRAKLAKRVRWIAASTSSTKIDARIAR